MRPAIRSLPDRQSAFGFRQGAAPSAEWARATRNRGPSPDPSASARGGENRAPARAACRWHGRPPHPPRNAAGDTRPCRAMSTHPDRRCRNRRPPAPESPRIAPSRQRLRRTSCGDNRRPPAHQPRFPALSLPDRFPGRSRDHGARQAGVLPRAHPETRHSESESTSFLIPARQERPAQMQPTAATGSINFSKRIRAMPSRGRRSTRPAARSAI